MVRTVGKWIGAIICMALAVQVSHAQQILFRHYTAADGLCSNTIWSISQDDQGYMWFGTKDGLNRFDGYQFESYRYDKNDSTTLGGNAIRAILNFGQDSCWIGTEKGIYVLDLSEQVFHYFKPLGKKKVFDLMKGPQGDLWIATDQGIFKYSIKEGRLKHFMHHSNDSNSISNNFIRQLLLDNNGNIWIGTAWNGIDVYNPRHRTFIHYMATGEPGSLSSNFITALYKDLEGDIWIGTEKGGLNLWDRETKSFRQFKHTGANSISDNIVHSIYQPAPGKLYIGTEKGLDIFDIAGKKFTNYAYKPNDDYSLSDNAIYTIFQDKEGGIWLGTYFGGVNYFYREHPNFELYYPTGAANALSGKAVSAMLEADTDHIWIATEDGGLNYFNTRTKTFRHFPFNARQDNLSYHNIHTLIKDKAGRIWIGTFTGGVNIYDPRTGKVKVYKFGQGNQKSSYSNMIYAIYQDKDGVIWVGTVGGLYTYDPKEDDFTRIHEMGLSRSWIYDIYEDDRDVIWFGTYNRGLIGKNKRTGKWYHYTSDGKPGSLSSEKVICIAGGDSDLLWIGTDGGGLNRLDTKKGTITVLNNQSGLAADIVYGILKDKKGHLWLSTNNGLFDFDPRSESYRHYTQWDHIQSSQFNYKSYLKTSGGKFYFGGVHGFNAFYPDSIRNIHTTTKVAFTDFQLFNKEVPLHEGNNPLSKSITYTRHLTLSHRQSMFSFEYAALNYIAPKKTAYAYKMEGYDKDWNYVGNQRKATYTNLPAGDYVFKVKATDNNGNWSKQPAEMAITIRPPFYRTNIAYLIYAVAILAAILFFRRIELRRIKRRNAIKLERLKSKKEQEFYKRKIEFFTAMAHEIRTPLSLIIAPLEKLLDAGEWKPAIRNQLKVMDENSNRLLALTNQLLDFRRMESDVYDIHPEKIELVSFVQSLFSRFSSISYQKGIKFSISTQIHHLEVRADPEALTKILSNLLFNAFKFTRSKVELSINEPRDNAQGQSCFSISVEDDGIGIPQGEVGHIFEKFYQVSAGKHEYSNLGGNGIGLALARALAEKHDGELVVTSEEGVRTVFTILIPFQQKITGDRSADQDDTEIVISEENNEGAQTILIVEDDLSLLEFISGNMQEEGFKALKAPHGAAAFKLLRKHAIDLIISDVMMPEMDGMEFCRKVKKDVNFSHIPFILLTAKANPETEIQGIEEGADAYITKPFKWKHLSAVIKNLLESRQKLRLKFSHQPFAEAASLTTNTGDQKFLKKIIDVIEGRLDDQQLSVEELSSEMAMSRSSLHKKLKAISGHVPNEFIRIIRLKHAAKLLLQNEHSISEIGYMTGFNSPSYFSKCFFQQFKLTPREFIEKNQVPG